MSQILLTLDQLAATLADALRPVLEDISNSTGWTLELRGVISEATDPERPSIVVEFPDGTGTGVSVDAYGDLAEQSGGHGRGWDSDLRWWCAVRDLNPEPAD